MCHLSIYIEVRLFYINCEFKLLFSGKSLFLIIIGMLILVYVVLKSFMDAPSIVEKFGFVFRELSSESFGRQIGLRLVDLY